MASKIITLLICINMAASNIDIDDIYGDVTLQGPLKVRVRPTTSSATESIRFAPDPRGQNSIITDDAGIKRWRIVSKMGRQLLDWPLTLSLDSTLYGFEPNKADSAVAVTMRGFCELTSECDAFFSIAIGDRYFSFATDFDGIITTGTKYGIQVYPACGQALATGDPTGFLGQATGGTPTAMWYSLRRVLAGGNYNAWHQLRFSNSHNGENFPVTFELINNDIDDTFTMRFGSDTFNRGDQLECVFKGAAPTNSEIKVFMTNDWPNNANEIMVVKSFTINGNKFRNEEEEEQEQVFAVKESMESQYDGSNNTVEIIGLLIVVIMVIGVILNRYCFVGGDNVKVLKQESDPLLINVQ